MYPLAESTVLPASIAAFGGSAHDFDFRRVRSEGAVSQRGDPEQDDNGDSA